MVALFRPCLLVLQFFAFFSFLLLVPMFSFKILLFLSLELRLSLSLKISLFLESEFLEGFLAQSERLSVSINIYPDYPYHLRPEIFVLDIMTVLVPLLLVVTLPFIIAFSRPWRSC